MIRQLYSVFKNTEICSAEVKDLRVFFSSSKRRKIFVIISNEVTINILLKILKYIEQELKVQRKDTISYYFYDAMHTIPKFIR